MKIAKGHYVPKELITSEAVHEAVVKCFVAAGFKIIEPCSFGADIGAGCLGVGRRAVGGIIENPLTLQQLFTAENGICWPDGAESVISYGGDCLAFVGDDVWKIISGKMLGFETKMPITLATRQPKEKEVSKVQLIDNAIHEHNGVWPSHAGNILKVAGPKNTVHEPFSAFDFSCQSLGSSDYWIFLCERKDFERRAKPLGYINGCRWGVEYQVNGKRPDLPGDVLVEFKCASGSEPERFLGELEVSDVAWNKKQNPVPATSFRVTDHRYEPADTSYLNALTQAKSLTHSEEGLTHKHDLQSVSEISESKREAENVSDSVKNHKHYQIIEGVESITIIASSMTVEQWHGFCLGNILKYRIRAGKKGDLQQDIAKADYYQELYEMHKHLCRVSA